MIFKHAVEICTTCLELAGIIVLVQPRLFVLSNGSGVTREYIAGSAQELLWNLKWAEVPCTVVVREMGTLVSGVIIRCGSYDTPDHWRS